MDLFLQQVLNGLTLGSIYGLVALGLTLVYGILHVPNFAHGALYMVGAYVSYITMVDFGANYWIAMIASAISVAVLAVLCERLVFNPLREAPPIHDKIAAIGIMLFLEAMVQMKFGAEFRRMPTPYTDILDVAGMTIPAQRVLIIIGAFALMAVLHLFLKKTMTGSTIVAMAQNREGAFLVGIDANRVAMMTFAISGVLAAVGATLFAPINLVYPAMGHLLIMKAFVIIILGGMGSIPGAIVGGLIIGFAEAFGGFYISTDYKDIIAFALLVLILSVKPTGLFTKGVR
ncbi:MAG: branched-chain amino acid ABC transporter permease [Pseudomonadales bacterium]|uniref:Branched-chain amino acid ABC transporter permease n=1 Tax=Alcanivorax profundi TaxID=2338368 RepID=A0A418XXR8_9GAMM|nr:MULTISPECIES: branched-chain amino acid ABC transporter permease [Alcanivorax]MCG8439779.1 branched-chain amino acid ABC transporter permease [Pseudomonadales bacterium]MED5431740.1 branched-chain amino acid ABC transporter permease [Pseudomonadota bacterium]MEE2870078.1 branched-chain amino acid ABC transporter permease [Pseudomonadota bacterium]PNE01738.1 branched chain amino acid ABC transporter permease [Alcanivorax sp. MD8A]RJG17593.1 branched-chain amino acid ABC transporter permease 